MLCTFRRLFNFRSNGAEDFSEDGPDSRPRLSTLLACFPVKYVLTLTGWSDREALGRALGEVFQAIDATSRQPVGNPLAAAPSEKKHVPLCSHRPVELAALIRR
jgi:hypothetical protein